jgi:stage V sporulation protein D (sporulation-specific penicillin-binding protein)
MEVSGKTGTAQVASARGGYIPGKYVSSFIGYAPAENPEIVCLVMLDEPRYSARYGGVSCAPVFAEVCRAAANATPFWDDVMAAGEIRPPAVNAGRYRAPNFLRMDRGAALEKARKIGSNVLCQGDQGRVVSQEPNPGVAMREDDVIRLYIADGGKKKKKRTTPDLRGLPVRKAKLTLAKNGFKCALVGSGVVKSQKPAPGQSTSYQTVKIYCEEGTPGNAGGSP